MKLTTRQIQGCTGNSGDLRRSTPAQLVALRMVAKLVAEGLYAGRLPAGCMPAGRPHAGCLSTWCMSRRLAPLSIASIGKFSAFRLSLPVAHVR